MGDLSLIILIRLRLGSEIFSNLKFFFKLIIIFRVYLVLMTGGIAQLPKALTGEEVEEEERTSVDVVGRR